MVFLLIFSLVPVIQLKITFCIYLGAVVTIFLLVLIYFSFFVQLAQFGLTRNSRPISLGSYILALTSATRFPTDLAGSFSPSAFSFQLPTKTSEPTLKTLNGSGNLSSRGVSETETCVSEYVSQLSSFLCFFNCFPMICNLNTKSTERFSGSHTTSLKRSEILPHAYEPFDEAKKFK